MLRPFASVTILPCRLSLNDLNLLQMVYSLYYLSRVINILRSLDSQSLMQ